MTAAIVNVCFDPRLNHEVIRMQTQTRLEAQQLRVQRIFITNEAGGNFGSALRNAVNMLASSGEDIALIALLDHDDCQAAAAGMRQPLEDRVAEVAAYAAERKVKCPVASGTVTSNGNVVDWTDWPGNRYGGPQPIMPTMPKLFG